VHHTKTIFKEALKVKGMMKFLSALLLVLSFTFVSAQKKVTYFEHIAPIIQERCAPCHRPGTAAPFSLLTYEDAAKRAKMIGRVTGTRYMPPWKADHLYRSFANEKRLTEDEIEKIKQWVADDAPRGKEPKSGKVRETNIAASHGKAADAILRVHKPFIVAGDLKENFTLSVIPFDFDREPSVESIEYISDNLKLIHHANFGIYAVDPSIDISGDTVSINANDLSDYATRLTQLTQNLVYYNGWVPGSTPITFSKGLGFKLPKHGVIVLTNHYAPSPVQKTERSSLQFYFSKTAVERTVNTLSIGSGGVGEITPSLMIFPNEVKAFHIRMEIVEPLSLLYVWPHMHLIGKKFTAYYSTAAHDTVPLVRINDWDFNWQEAYKFKQLMKIPKGAVLTIEGIYDNTAQNPHNPNSPPMIVFSDGLMGTKNEMLSLILVYLPYKEGDENIDL
jgi:hypothetical protein